MITIIRILIAIMILTLLITYAIIPLVKHFKNLIKKEAKRIDKSLTDKKEEKDDLK